MLSGWSAGPGLGGGRRPRIKLFYTFLFKCCQERNQNTKYFWFLCPIIFSVSCKQQNNSVVTLSLWLLSSCYISQTPRWWGQGWICRAFRGHGWILRQYCEHPHRSRREDICGCVNIYRARLAARLYPRPTCSRGEMGRGKNIDFAVFLLLPSITSARHRRPGDTLGREISLNINPDPVLQTPRGWGCV